MGYYARIRDHNLRIANLDRATKLLNEAGYSGRDFVECLYNSGGYEDVGININGDVDYLVFDGKYRDEETLWKAIAEVITSVGNSKPYIEWQGEDNELWRFVFENGELTEVGCDIIWPYLGERPRPVPAVVEPLAITTEAGLDHLRDALSLELTKLADQTRANEIRMAIKTIEDAKAIILNLEVPQ